MTRIKALQILVYITFGLLMAQGSIEAAYSGFKEGYEDGYYAANNNHRQRGPLLITVFNGDLLTHKSDGEVKIDNNYTLQNITINGQLRLSASADTTPWWLTALYVIVTFGVAITLLFTAITINKIIVKIAGGTMFDDACIKLINRTAMLLLLYAVGDYLYQRIAYIKDSRLVKAPFLSVANTTEFNFKILLCAIMVFILAETFKHAARLKQEQDLTI